MKIFLMSNKAFENQKMANDLNSIVMQVKPNNYFIKNPEVGIYDVERLGTKLTEAEKRNFWNNVAAIMNDIYDVDINDEELHIYKKGFKSEHKLNNGEKNDNRSNKKIKQETKKEPKPRVSKKPNKVEKDK